MSRKYEMELRIEEKVTKEERRLIEEAFESRWCTPTEDYPDRGGFVLVAEGSLGGGMREETWARLMQEDVWSRVKRHVNMTVVCRYLDDPPTEMFEAEEADFAEWKRIAICNDCRELLFPGEGETGCRCNEED